MTQCLFWKPSSIVLFVIFSFIFLMLAGCYSETVAVDHEQVSKEERIVIRFSHIVGEKTPKGLAARKFAEMVKEKTDGYVEIQVFANGSLYKDGEEVEALLRDDIQMIAPAMSKLTSYVPEWRVMDLPFAFQTVEEVHEYLEGEMGSRLLGGLERKGFYPLGIWDNSFKQMTNMEKPLIHPEDFSGLRFRIMPSEVIRQQFSALEASVQSNSFDEVYRLLEKNQIHGQENTFSNIVSKGIHTQQRYMIVSSHGYLGYTVLMNEKFWNGLPPDIQTALKESMAEVTEWEQQLAKELNEEGLKEIKACGCMEIHYLSDKERQVWEEAFKPIYQKFEDRFGAKYIKQLPKNKEDKKKRR